MEAKKGNFKMSLQFFFCFDFFYFLSEKCLVNLGIKIFFFFILNNEGINLGKNLTGTWPECLEFHEAFCLCCVWPECLGCL
ncbi:hypothetical protein QVD17_00567 [Tagetes erecta]|uniref:Uncharacterized protein n=1 Tax=Tagetes erecta TaxID=13708 RepID=A0AAD8L830_TARER|nr:hypothetical protein QVD17_00567 [Tagetes erecta]